MPITTLDSWLRKPNGQPARKAVVLRELRWNAATTAGDWAMELVSPTGWTIRRRDPLSLEEIGRLLRERKC